MEPSIRPSKTSRTLAAQAPASVFRRTNRINSRVKKKRWEGIGGRSPSEAGSSPAHWDRRLGFGPGWGFGRAACQGFGSGGGEFFLFLYYLFFDFLKIYISTFFYRSGLLSPVQRVVRAYRRMNRR